jgi:Methyltransferase FkbM domain
MKALKRTLNQFYDFVTGQATTSKEILAVLKKMRPVSTNYPLIRIGGIDDGGYLIPDDLTGIKVCFSPGVADTCDFESAMADRGIACFMADYSVEGPPLQNKHFHFEKKFIGPVETATHMTLENWVNRNAPDKTDFILQMDIEDSEYNVILSTPRETLKKFRIMTIEFHRFRKLLTKAELKKFAATFEKLLLDFEIVHVHPNNHSRVINYRGLKIPLVMEYTFLRKDRVKSKQSTTVFPHPLDKANIPNKPDRVLPECWYIF